MATLTTSWKSYASASYSNGTATITFYLEAKYSSQSIANNTTNVQTRLRSAFTKGSSLRGAGYKFTCSYASTRSGSGVWAFEDEVILSGSSTITHTASGTKTISLSATAHNDYWNFTKTLSASVSLPTIPRFPEIISGQNFTDETDNVTITFTNPRKTNPIRLKLEAGGNPDLIIRDFGSTVTSGTITLTEAEKQTLRALIPNSNTLSVRETVRAMSGETPLSLSYKDYTMTIVNANPTFNASYEDTNASSIAITGNNQLLIQDKSTLQINVANATAYKYATLSSITVQINGVTYNGTLDGSNGTINVGALNIAENTDAVVTLTDSRGYTATQTLNLQFLGWQLPTANITLQRQNNYYSETDIKVDANYSSLDNKNTITIQVREKKQSDSTWSSYTTLQDNVSSTLTLDNKFEWDVQVVITDRLGSTTYNLTLDKGMPIIYFDRLKRSVGVNCFPNDDESLEVQYETEQYNVGKIINKRSAITCTTGSSNRTINVTTTWALYKQTLTDIKAQVGNTFTLTNNEILVNEDCYALVSKNGLMRGPTTNAILTRVGLYRNGSQIQYSDSYIYCANANYWYGNNISPVLWELKAGDVIRAELSSGVTGSIGFAGNTYITVQRVV